MFETPNSVNRVADTVGASSADQLQNQRRTELGQEDFLALLTTQLAQQDPFKPLDNTEFIAQMAQFSSLESLQSMQESFASLASAMTSNQALQASALVGRTVLVPSNVASFDGSNEVTGVVALAESSAEDAKLIIEDEFGQVIRTIELGDLQQGPNDFTWDGTDDNGNPVDAGYYAITVTGGVYGQETNLATGVFARVDSVNLGGSQGGVYLNLDGLGSVSLDEVSQIRN